MSVLLSLLTALFFGAGDFVGGLAAQRTRVVEVVAGAHLLGLFGALAAAVIIADEFSLRDFGLGAVAGVFGGVGIYFLYRRLAAGPMSVVAPLTAVTSAVVPVAADVADGTTFAAEIWLGIALAFVAIVVISTADDNGATPVTSTVVVESLLAGAGFGGFFIVLDLTESASAPWPIVGARLATVTILTIAIAFGRRPTTTRDLSTLVLIAAAGTLDTLSNTLFLYATLEGELAVVVVLSSLYPVVTVLLAQVVLGERIGRVQAAGAGLALVATLLIATG